MKKQFAPIMRPAGETSGSPCRSPHQVKDLPLAFDLDAEIDQLHWEEGWRHGERNAKTLIKEPDLRVLLIALRPGARIDRHHAPGRITIQTLSGRLRLEVCGERLELPAGRLLAVDAETEHDVEALDESAFLLTIACPRRKED